MIRTLALSAPILFACALSAVAQDPPKESDIDRKIRELKSQFDKRLQELDREKENLRRELDRQVGRLKREAEERVPGTPRSLEELMRSLERMLDRFGGVEELLRGLEDRMRRMEEKLPPELRGFRDRLPAPRDWFDRFRGRDERREFRWPKELPRWEDFFDRWLEEIPPRKRDREDH